jgi:hypothetical protein
MQEEDWKKFIKKTHESYRKIGSIPCPAFNGELVYFNRNGWKHLIRKGRIPRTQDEQLERLQLISKAPLLLNTSSKYHMHTIELQGKSIAHFWSFVNKNKITIIVRQINNGPRHFFSIFKDNTS